MTPRRTRLGTAAASVLTLVVLTGVAVLPSSGSAGSNARLTIDAKGKPRVYKSKRATPIVGKAIGVPGAAGQSVTLLASVFPYESVSAVDTTTIRQDRTYRFKVKPQINTAYRVALVSQPQVRSARQKVFVFPKEGFRIRTKGGGLFVKARLTLRYSPDVSPEPLVGRKAYWYFQKVRASVARRVKATRLKALPAGGVRASVVYRPPRTRHGYRYFFYPCVGAPPKDVGVGNAKPHRCPPKVRVRGRAARFSAAPDPEALLRR